MSALQRVMPRLAGAALVAAMAACGGDEAADASPAAAASDGLPDATTAPTATTATTGSPAPGEAADPAVTSPAADSGAPASPTSASQAVASGERFVSPDGVFAVVFDAAPNEQSTEAPTPDGGTLPVTAYLGAVGDYLAVVSCVEVFSVDGAPEPEVALGEARDGAIANFGATLIASDPTERQGRPGIAYSATIGDTGALRGETYVDGPRSCQLLTIGEPADIAAAASTFFASFEFLEPAA